MSVFSYCLLEIIISSIIASSTQRNIECKYGRRYRKNVRAYEKGE